MLCNINIWALLVSSLAALVVSGFWYSDYAFGKQWRAFNSNLFTMGSDNATRLYIGQFILTLITNFVLARVLFFTGASSWIQGLAVALLVWVGFVAALGASSILWEKKPWKLVAINTGSYLATLIVSAIIFTLWN